MRTGRGPVALTDPALQRGRRPGLMINLVVSDAVLFGTSDEPAYVDGHGPVDADLAREWAADSARDDEAEVWLRRLYVQPETGSLVAMDSRSRIFPSGLATFIRLRDQVCRAPWCDAPIRHSDHVAPAARGGPTSGVNGDGLCEACNLAKEALAPPRRGDDHADRSHLPLDGPTTGPAPLRRGGAGTLDPGRLRQKFAPQPRRAHTWSDDYLTDDRAPTPREQPLPA